MTTERDHADEMPDDLADRAGLQLMTVKGEGRAAMLARLVAAHPQYERALRCLAADLARVDGVLADSFASRTGDLFTDVLDVGGHRVIRCLGEGAFGVVYLCAQEWPVTRQVAVKVVRPGAGGPETLRRFAAERQLLAALNHPSITQVFDAGELADGRPYFIMEYVEGAPIRAYCDDQGLAVRDRLRLFADVCRGVAHAHARGIVHRDLKPANVLVVASDSGAQPKIIDFGIAKALVAPHDDLAPHTEAGRVIGTPGYMSPEQASGRVAEVDARADVFALGVMLYELLTRELPWVMGAAATPAEPPLPSSRVTKSGATAGETAVLRRRQLAAELRGDLDWITLKALARDRAERYQTVAAFAADIERHLRGEAVSVGPPTIRYRLRKCVRRNRGIVAVAAGAALVCGVVVGFFHLRTAHAETVAERAMAQATLAVERLVVRAGDERLRLAPANDVVRQVLAQDAIGFYDQWLRDRPRERRLRMGRCQALTSLSSVHWLLGRMADAERTAAEAVGEAEDLFAQKPDDLSMRGMLAEALRRHGRALGSLRRVPEAAVSLTRAVEHFEICSRAAPDRASRSLSGTCLELAAAREFLRETAASLDAVRRAVAVLEDHLRSGPAAPEVHTDVALARCALTRNLVAMGRIDEAAGIIKMAEEGLANVTVDAHRATARVHSTWAHVARRRDDWPLAREHSLLAVAADERWRQHDPTRPLSGQALVEDLDELAEAHERTGHARDADETMQSAITHAEARAAAAPTDATPLLRLEVLLSRFAHRLYERHRLPDLERAQTWMQRALAVQVAIAKLGAATTGPRTRALVILAMVVEARGEATETTWDPVAATLPVDADVRAPGHDFDFAGWCGVARSRLRSGKVDDAAAAIAQAARWVPHSAAEAARAPDVEWLRACVALQRGDLEAAIAGAERIVDVEPEARGWWRAADCYFAAWRQLELATERTAATATATAERDMAAELYRRVIDDLANAVRTEPDEPWHVVPWAFACLQLAQIESACGQPEKASQLLDPALAALEHIAPLAPRDRWQPDTIERAKALQTGLRARPR